MNLQVWQYTARAEVKWIAAPTKEAADFIARALGWRSDDNRVMVAPDITTAKEYREAECDIVVDSQGPLPAPPKVWLVQGEHPTIPGLATEVHARKEAAELAAANLVVEILRYSEGENIEGVTAQNWEERLKPAIEEHGEEYTWVTVTEQEVLP